MYSRSFWAGWISRLLTLTRRRPASAGQRARPAPHTRRIDQRQRILRRSQLAAHEDARVAVDHPALDRDRQVAVDLPRAAAGDDSAHRPLRDAPGHDDDPLSRPVDQLGDQFQPFQRRRLLPRCQDAIDPQSDQRLERLERITRHVKGAVAGHAQRPRQLDEDAHPLDVHRTIRVKQPDHDTIRADALAQLNVQLHRLELDVRIAEVAPARPDDDIQGDLQQPAGELNRARAGSAAAFQQVGAQFHAIGAAHLCGERGLHGIHTGLKQNVRGHSQLLTDTWPRSRPAYPRAARSRRAA